jgi:hypothetical protein
MDSEKPVHRKTAGFAVCIHTCVPDGCRNLHGRVLWNRDGNPLRKHAANRAKHQQCNEICPGYDSLGQTHGTFAFSRIPTAEDIDLDHEINMDIDIPQPSRSAASQALIAQNQPASSIQYLREHSLASIDSQSTVDLNYTVDPATSRTRTITATEKHRTFKIIYVPDPTRTCTPSRAESNLAFLKTAISEHEFNAVKHLEGSIHLVSCRQTGPENSRCVVYMQEWVRPYIFLCYFFNGCLSCASWFGCYGKSATTRN